MAFARYMQKVEETIQANGDVQEFWRVLYTGTDVANGADETLVTVIIAPGDTVNTINAKFGSAARTASSGILRAAGGVGVTVLANQVLLPAYAKA